jgi:hypothetical protein
MHSKGRAHYSWVETKPCFGTYSSVASSAPFGTD